MKVFTRVEPFEPLSPKQVMAYLKHQGYKVPTNRKTHKETASEEALLGILQKHPEDKVLPLVLEARALSKAAGYLSDTYVGRDGRFHPEYTFHPNSGRLAARSPNIMNQPNPGRLKDAKAELADAVRSTIIASPGFTLVEADWRNVEAVLTGYFANDPDYIRLSLLGSHAYFGLHVRGTPPDPNATDEELSALFKKFKAEDALYPLAKQVNLATSYGMGAFLLAKTLGISVAEAKRLLHIKETMAPKVKAWIDATRQLAHKEHHLVNPWGYVSPYFFEVFAISKYTGKWTLGKQANEVLSFKPQSSGASMLREVLIAFDALACEDFHPLAPIHDSVLFEIRDERLGDYLPMVEAQMTREWPELGGMRMQVEIKVGKAWNEMRTAA